MQEAVFTILKNEPLAPRVYRMELAGDTGAITAPGQFVNILLEGFYLRRPISVCDWAEGRLTLVYKVVGRGTEAMRKMGPGETLDMLVGLGNGFDTVRCGKDPLLIGGGVGAPPMYGLAKALVREGKCPTVVLGFNTESEVFLKEDFERLGVQVRITTVDGSAGTKGFVTAAFDGEFTDFCACGPEPMLRAAAEVLTIPGQLSFEERMGCGFGACMGCSCETKYGSKRICKDGPVLTTEEVIW